MDIIFFLILIILFIMTVSFILKLGARKSKNFLLVGSVAALMIMMLVFVGDHYRKWDARLVISLFLLTIILGIFFSLRRTFYK